MDDEQIPVGREEGVDAQEQTAKNEKMLWNFLNVNVVIIWQLMKIKQYRWVCVGGFISLFKPIKFNYWTQMEEEKKEIACGKGCTKIWVGSHKIIYI